MNIGNAQPVIGAGNKNAQGSPVRVFYVASFGLGG